MTTLRKLAQPSPLHKAIHRAKQLERKSVSMDAPPPMHRLQTRLEVIAEIKQRIATSSLTEVAGRHKLSPQQLSDIIYARANLSRKALEKLRFRAWTYYERLPDEFAQ